MFLLVPAYPGCPGSKAVKRSSSLLLLLASKIIKSVLSVHPIVYSLSFDLDFLHVCGLCKPGIENHG